MIILLKAQYSGISTHGEFEGEIVFGNRSPHDAAKALYAAISGGKDLDKRRGEWDFCSTQDGKYKLRIIGRDGAVESTYTIYKPVRATFDMTTEEGRNAWQTAYIAALGSLPPEPVETPAPVVQAVELSSPPFAAGVVLPYRLALYWNGRLVLDATATAALAYGSIRRHVLDNFVRLDDKLPTLEAIIAMRPGETKGGTFDDETERLARSGVASFYLACI